VGYIPLDDVNLSRT